MPKAKQHVFTYICEECTIVFQTFGFISNKPICPKCGDSIEVRRHYGIHSTREGVKNLKTRWTGKELELLQTCLNGKITPYQLAIMTGRSRDSVMKKVKRTKALG